MSKKVIPIFFACDDNYIPLLGTAINSLIRKASSEYDYKIIVLNPGMKESNVQRIQALEQDNLSISFFDISPTVAPHMAALSLRLRDYYSVAIYYRMFIPHLFTEYDKAIYLDADLILMGDISELYNVDISDKLVAAINDKLVTSVPAFINYVDHVVGVDSSHYFNSGVLLMNLDKFRKDNIENKFLDLLYKYNFDSVCPDQDYLNYLCRNDKLMLETGWNKMPLPDSEFDYATIKLLHYNSFEKPWHHTHVLFSDEFWHEAQHTPFYTDLLALAEKGKTQAFKEADKRGGEKLVAKAIRITNEEQITFKKVLG